MVKNWEERPKEEGVECGDVANQEQVRVQACGVYQVLNGRTTKRMCLVLPRACVHVCVWERGVN